MGNTPSSPNTFSTLDQNTLSSTTYFFLGCFCLVTSESEYTEFENEEGTQGSTEAGKWEGRWGGGGRCAQLRVYEHKLTGARSAQARIAANSLVLNKCIAK